jgi:hypothetical protein
LEQAQRPAALSFGGRGTADRHQHRFGSAVQLGREGRRRSPLAIQRRAFSLKDKTRPDACDGIDVETQDRGDLVVGVTSSRVIRIAQQQHTGVQNLLGRGTAVMRDRLQMLAGLGGQYNGILVVWTIHG